MTEAPVEIAAMEEVPYVPPAIVHPTREAFKYPQIRPDPPDIDPFNEDFEFLQIDSEYRIIPGRGLQIYMYGETLAGNSVVLKTHGFNPHFTIKRPDLAFWDVCHFEMFRESLEKALRKKVGRSGDARQFTRLIKGMSIYKAIDLYDYHGEDPEDYLKIEVAYPKLVRECRLLLEYPNGKQKTKSLPEIEDWWPQDLPIPVEDPFKDKEKHSGYPRYFQIYEANLDYMLRFQVDHKIRATGWVKIKKEQFKVCGVMERDSTSQIELICDHTAVGYSARTTKELPPLSAYSYDAECRTAPDGGFPKAVYYANEKDEKEKKNPIPGSGEQMIQMGFQKVFGSKSSKGVHMIGTSAPVKDADELYCYDNENNFLRGFKMDIQACDPTYLVQYNGCNFDNPYYIERQKQTGLWDHFGDLGRLVGVKSRYYSSTFNSSAHKTEKLVTNINGRVQVDVMQCVKKEKKLRSYGLNAVAGKFLERNKIEMDYQNINTLQDGTPEDRASLAYYCMVDAMLPWELIVKLKMVLNYLQVMAHSDVSDFADGSRSWSLYSAAFGPRTADQNVSTGSSFDGQFLIFSDVPSQQKHS